jgi:hypothetical protein
MAVKLWHGGGCTVTLWNCWMKTTEKMKRNGEEESYHIISFKSHPLNFLIATCHSSIKTLE